MNCDATEDPNLLEHRQWMSVWCELTYISSGGFTPHGKQLPLTQEQRDAYRAIPDVLDRLEEAWALLPEDVRPLHYLQSV